jgi:glucose-6-phosphate 1-epimerase
MNSGVTQANSLHEIEVAPGFPGVELRHASGATCRLSLYGAQILSYIPAGKGEVYFCSSKATFAEGKAIRGGVPLVFPQFGKGALPSHGFARTMAWSVAEKVISTPTGDVALTLSLVATDETKAMWPHEFVCEYVVTLGDSLVTSLTVKNVGSAPFSYQAALHPYYLVDDIRNVSVAGLHGLTLIDFLKERSRHREEREVVTFQEATDRVYLSSPSSLSITTSSSGRTVRLEKSGFHDSVVWNPWIEGNAGIGDLAEGDYTCFVCVEPGSVVEAITLAPGESWTGWQRVGE